MTTDEGFREIQLNGKQLVFLFMAATVVSVVLFLCGVLVGRGVRADQPAAPDSAGTPVAPDTALPPEASSSSVPMAQAPTAEPPAEVLSYPDRLQKDTPARENLKASPPGPPSVMEPTPRASAPAPPTAAPAALAAQPAAADAHAPSVSTQEPSGSGFAVQVATYPDRRNADNLAKRLIGKGYPAFVTGPVKGGAKMIYRVRVGKYQNRREADAVSSRLEKEEQFKPWIAR